MFIFFLPSICKSENRFYFTQISHLPCAHPSPLSSLLSTLLLINTTTTFISYSLIINTVNISGRSNMKKGEGHSPLIFVLLPPPQAYRRVFDQNCSPFPPPSSLPSSSYTYATNIQHPFFTSPPLTPTPPPPQPLLLPCLLHFLPFLSPAHALARRQPQRQRQEQQQQGQQVQQQE